MMAATVIVLILGGMGVCLIGVIGIAFVVGVAVASAFDKILSWVTSPHLNE
jgi:hypothetical protein